MSFSFLRPPAGHIVYIVGRTAYLKADAASAQFLLNPDMGIEITYLEHLPVAGRLYILEVSVPYEDVWYEYYNSKADLDTAMYDNRMQTLSVSEIPLI